MTKKATEKEKIINSCYAVKMELPECITDYDSFFEDLGFTKEAVRNEDVRIIKSNSRYITISYDDKSKEIEKWTTKKRCTCRLLISK